MELVFETTENYTKYPNKIFLVSDFEEVNTLNISPQAKVICNKKTDCCEKEIVSVETADERVFIIQTAFVSDFETRDELRRKASHVFGQCKKEKLESFVVVDSTLNKENMYAVIESMYLSSYIFDEYKSSKEELPIEKIACVGLSKNDLKEIELVSRAVFAGRDYINHPIINFNALRFANEIEKLFVGTKAKVQIYDKAWIENENMGGLLAVNKGSVDEPRFVHVTYNPLNSSDKPIVMVGKGIVYDTGGLSLKPSQYMEHMKSDMGGAAAVVGTIKAVAEMDMPLYIEALIPITDNRPGGNAYAPGDVIKMRSGLFVEVLNTDAEGRMVLADALDYAKSLNPKIVVDMATLTGAANMTVGENAAVYMGTAEKELMDLLEETSLKTWEPLVKLPLFNYYEKLIKSDIADIKNVGGPLAGSITAGKFLQKFTDYPWMHLDLSGSSFAKTKNSYKGVGGTAFGVRTMYEFFKAVQNLDV